MTVRDRIDAAIQSAVAWLEIEVEIEPIGDPSQFPGLAVFIGGHAVLEREATLTRYQGEFTIEGYVEGSFGEAPVAERNALQARVVEAIMADETLGGTVELVEDADCRFATATLAEVRRLMFAQDFVIQFTTARGNPANPA